ncbi:MAG: hypothetical protein Q9228_003883 [Teloschistes exilis]
MAGLSLLSNAQDSQLRIIHVVKDETVDEEENVVRNQSLDDSDAVMEDLNFIMFGDMGKTDTANGLEIAIIHSSKISAARARCSSSVGRHDSSHRPMRLIWETGTHYNLRENRDPEIRGGTVHLHYNWQSLKFLYNVKSGRATYLLACSDEDFEYYAKALDDWKMPGGRRPHPFCIHLILLFKSVFAWNQELENALAKLLYLENRSIFRSSKVTFERADETKRRLQELHRLFKDVLIWNNTNKRHIEMIGCLTRDLDRILTTVRCTEDAFPIDEHDHQRIVDGFKGLKNFCLDRERRLTSRAQRVQNLIALVGFPNQDMIPLTHEDGRHTTF